jgi:drug/metabolite transporter (DMT)-like permease
MDKTQPAEKNRSLFSLLLRHDADADKSRISARSFGILAALTSAFFLGMTPIFGRQAILLGAPPLAVVAIRTLLATGLLLGVMILFYRPYLYIYPVGLLGCLLAGWINGIGSLFYYRSLASINAGVGQLLYSLYPFFLVMWLLILDRQIPSRLTIIRVSIAICAVYLLTQAGYQQMNPIGVGLMLVASALYALHIPINQRVLYDMPSPTVTVYTLLAMSSIVVPTYLFSRSPAVPSEWYVWLPVLGLTLVTFFSRLTLFFGVKHLGGMQTVLLGLSEILVTLFFAHTWLHEEFSHRQWLGVLLLIFSLMLVVFDKQPIKKQSQGGLLGWLQPPTTPTDIPWQLHE